MTQKQLKAIKDASAVASSVWKSKKRILTENQIKRFELGIVTLAEILNSYYEKRRK